MDAFDLAARGENDGLWDWNLTTSRVHFSPRWIALLGLESHEVGNTPTEWFRRIHPEDLERVQVDIDTLLAGDLLQFENQHRLLHKDGTYRWMSCYGKVMVNENGQPVRLTGSHSDITAEKVVDTLTGLPNRLLFLDRLTRSIERARRHSDFLYAVLLFDLDRFKSLMERLGSTAADQLLIAGARRLETCLRASDTLARFGQDHVVARLGGDEFIILLDGLNEVGDAKTVAERLLREISAPFEIGGQELFLTASIGIALSVTGYSRPEEALRDADTALHRAKSLGKARCEIFDTAILESAQSRLQLEADLREALERQELSVAYQPIVSLASSHTAGFEVLVRWKHPVRGMVSPQDFIPIAERTGLIVPLGRWVLHEACRQLKIWQDDLGIPKELFVSVNISSLQLKQPSVVEQIGEVLSDAGIEPRCLMLELTESAVMEHPQAVSSLLMQLRVLGVRIGIDDFGTGYSSLGYLRQFPVDFLKIDHSFVRRIETSDDLVEIVRTIGGLARQLGLHVIAEGIENAEQLKLIRALKCDYGQGFLFSRPIDSEKVRGLLKPGVLQQEWMDYINEAGEEDITGTEQSDQRHSLPAEVDSLQEAPLIGQQEGGYRQGSKSSLIALAALLLLLAAGYVVRLDRVRSRAPDEKTSAESVTPLKVASGDPAVGEPAPLSEVTSKGNASAKSAAPLEVASGESLTGKPAQPLNIASKGNVGAKSAAPREVASGKSVAGKPAPPRKVISKRNASAESAPPPEVASGKSVAEKPALPLNITSKGNASAESVPSEALTRDPAPSDKKSLSITYHVVHQHVLGSCRGELRISQDALTFASERDKDSFIFPHSEYSPTLVGDHLIIKSSSKTYRFKSADAHDKDENRSQLQKISKRISSFHRDAQSEKP